MPRPPSKISAERRSSPSPGAWRTWVPRLGLLLCIAFAYSKSLDVPFLFDDYDAIVDHEALRQLFPPPASLWMKPDSPLASRPLTGFTFALNFAWGGLDPRGYHVVNLLIHLANVLLLYELLRQTAGNHPGLAGSLWPDTTWAFVATLVWGLHPLLIDAVTYITQRTELLASLFCLTTLVASLRGFGAVGRAWNVVAVAACGAGMLCKEVMVVTPVLVVAYDRAFHFPTWRAAWEARRPFYLALGGTWLILGAAIFAAPRGLSAGFQAGVSPWEYLATQAVVIPHYLGLVVWPADLCLDYGQSLEQNGWAIVAGGALLITLGVGTLRAWRTDPPLGFLGTWCFALLAPSSSFIPIATEIGAERRMYLASAGIIVLLIGMWERLIARLPLASLGQRRMVQGGMLVVVMLLAVATVRRNEQLLDPIGIWERTSSQRPNNPRAWVNYGVALLHLGGDESGAIRAWRTALQVQPSRQDAIDLLVPLLDAQGLESDADRIYHEALEHEPGHVGILVRLGDRLVMQEQEAAGAQYYERALRLVPTQPSALNGLGGVAARQGDYPAAERWFLQARAVMPHDATIRLNLAYLYAAWGKPEAAIAMARAAVDLDPQLAAGRALLEQLTQEKPRDAEP